MPVLFFNESNLSVTEQMLAEVGAGKDSERQMLTELRPEHTYKLLDLPWGAVPEFMDSLSLSMSNFIILLQALYCRL